MKTTPASVDAYLAALPEDRRAALSAVRAAIDSNLDPKFQEGMQYGMIGWSVPHSIYPAGYHCDPKQPLPFASLASQKSHMALYLFCTYLDEGQARWFRDAWTATGKRLDMGKSCVRFKRLEDVPLEVVSEAIRRVPVKAFIEQYEQSVPAARKAREKAQGAAPARGAKAKASPKSRNGTEASPSNSASRRDKAGKPSPASKASRPKR
ncbi:MAG: DUF1801 domain-containing protein [Phycisphaerales bacterium]